MEFKFDEAKTWLEDENGKQVAVLDHPEVRPGVVNLVHTEVDPSGSFAWRPGNCREDHTGSGRQPSGKGAESRVILLLFY